MLPDQQPTVPSGIGSAPEALSGADGQEALAAIPSPSRRLWTGLCIVLLVFIAFSLYTVHRISWLEDFQANVVQRNRKASLQLQRLQNDVYLLAIEMRDMAASQPGYPLRDWRSSFQRLRADMDDAVRQEGAFAVETAATRDKRLQLRSALRDFWSTADVIFATSAAGNDAAAHRLIQNDLEARRAVLSEIVARLLVLNDRAQSEAAETITGIYGRAKRDVVIVTLILLLFVLGTGLYTLQANRRTFERLHHLAERLETQSKQLRQLSWKLIDVQEETLRQVARDLHDEFGQILTAVGILLKRVQQRVSAHGAEGFVDEAMAKDVQTVNSIVQDTLQNIRDRSQMFRPAILDDFGLEQALQWFAAQFGRQTGVTVHLTCETGEGFVPREEAIHLYRIVQEALSNVARHSEAHEAWVTLSAAEGELVLEVRDQGKGFDTAARASEIDRPGFGLMGIRERAEHLRGRCAVISYPGKGTTVRVQVPLRRSAEQVRLAEAAYRQA
jgi:signal transduction histidine kinase